jgi:hypothetical protein
MMILSSHIAVLLNGYPYASVFTRAEVYTGNCDRSRNVSFAIQLLVVSMLTSSAYGGIYFLLLTGSLEQASMKSLKYVLFIFNTQRLVTISCNIKH